MSQREQKEPNHKDCIVTALCNAIQHGVPKDAPEEIKEQQALLGYVLHCWLCGSFQVLTKKPEYMEKLITHLLNDQGPKAVEVLSRMIKSATCCDAELQIFDAKGLPKDIKDLVETIEAEELMEQKKRSSVH